MLFQNVVGQQAAKQNFLHAVQQNRLPHALLLRGPAGVGKLPLALAAAQYIVCQNPGPADSCGQCSSCSKMAQGIHPDVHFAMPIFLQTVSGKTQTADEFMDDFRRHMLPAPYKSLAEWGAVLEAENKQLIISIAEIRELKRKMQLTAFEGKKKIVVIWHAEKINQEGANAFLKLLEEPPDDTHILLTLEEPAQLLPTILSRCQTLRVPPLHANEVAGYLTTTEKVDPRQANELATVADGSLTAALAALHHATDGLLDQFQRWMRLCYEGKFSSVHAFAEEVLQMPKETQKLFLHFALKKLRDALVIGAGAPQLAQLQENEKSFLQNFSKTLNATGIERAAQLLEEALVHVNRNANPALLWLQLSLDLHRVFTTGRKQAAVA
jgi:DNA polymerase-3 subunit delta'